MSQTTFIWDFDGTLADSYPAIKAALKTVYAFYHWDFNETEVMDFVIKESVGKLLEQLSQEHHVAFSDLNSFFIKEQGLRDDDIRLMPYAKEVLQFTKERGIRNFIYTHKGATTQAVLARLNIEEFFTEIITSANGFKRKPHPEGVIYLIKKYHLDQSQTYYIGDRKLDVAVAKNAGIRSFNLNQPDSAINHQIKNLQELTLLERI